MCSGEISKKAWILNSVFNQQKGTRSFVDVAPTSEKITDQLEETISNTWKEKIWSNDERHFREEFNR
jgi:hypothetical protein